MRRNDDCLNPVLPQWIYYEAGFLICGTIGILFVVLTPIIGMCFCVCRCCENCGGEMHQRQRKNFDCQRGFYTASLIATSIFIVWVLISFRSLSTCLSSLWDLLCEILLLFWNYKKLPRHEYVFRYSESRLAKIIKLPVQTCFCFVILPLPLHQSHLFSIRSDYISEGGKWENPLKLALSQTTLSISVILGLVVSPLNQKYRLPVTWWFFLSCLCGVF